MRLKHLPNAVSCLRIVVTGALWGVALLGHRPLFVGLLAFALFTDALDGYLARKYHLQSRLGAKLDTVADNLLAISTMGYIYILRPELLLDYGPAIALLGMGFLTAIVVQIVRYGRRVPVHLYSDKIAGYVVTAFLLHAFAFPPDRTFAYVTAAVVGTSLIEEIILSITRDSLDENVRSVFLPERPRNRKKALRNSGGPAMA